MMSAHQSGTDAHPAPEVVQAVVAALGDFTPDCSFALVGIDGRSGTGKTSLAERVAENFRSPTVWATVIGMDELYDGWDGLIPGIRDQLIPNILRPLADRRPAFFHSYDWETNEYATLRSIPPLGLLIIEGVGSTALGAGDFYDLRVWLEADTEVRRSRALARDGATFEAHWDSWARAEEELFAAGAVAAAADVRLQT